MADFIIYDPNDTDIPNRVIDYKESVNTPSNPDHLRNPDLSSLSGVEQKYWKRDNNDVVEMNQAEKDLVDCPDLTQYQKDKNQAIDDKTVDLIFLGCNHDGKVFSLSDRAQNKWMAIDNYVQKLKITFPYNITTIDDEIYTLDSKIEWESFIDSIMARIGYLIGGGNSLKASVLSAVDKDGVDAVTDNRT